MGTALALIYWVSLPFTMFFVKVITEMVPETRGINSLFIFLSVWLILPMFPVYMGIRYIKSKVLN